MITNESVWHDEAGRRYIVVDYDQRICAALLEQVWNHRRTQWTEEAIHYALVKTTIQPGQIWDPGIVIIKPTNTGWIVKAADGEVKELIDAQIVKDYALVVMA